MDHLSAEFAKQRASLKDDVSLLIQDAVKLLQASLDSLQSTVNSFQSRLTSVESVAGEWLMTAESNVRALQNQNQQLLDCLDDLENRSQRANPRILNIRKGSEDGKDLLKFMSELLMQVVGPGVFPLSHGINF
ncbi:hypothetical protein PAMP_009747 [Pampus punctatissimus]